MLLPMSFQRALLYSGVNQLASGRHSGEDRHRNALKTMQRAVLLCPGIYIKICLYCTAVRIILQDSGMINVYIKLISPPHCSVCFQMTQQPGQD